MSSRLDPSVRSFLAIELSEPLRVEACQCVDHLKARYPDFRFIDPANWHLTLHFFGYLSREQMNQIIKTLPLFLASAKSFLISWDGSSGAFPNLQNPAILWLGLGGDLEALFVLKKEIDAALQKMEFPIEKRPFKPHVTIARAKKGVRISSVSFPTHPFVTKVQTRVESVTLFQTELLASGAKYSPLHCFPL